MSGHAHPPTTTGPAPLYPSPPQPLWVWPHSTPSAADPCLALLYTLPHCSTSAWPESSSLLTFLPPSPPFWLFWGGVRARRWWETPPPLYPPSPSGQEAWGSTAAHTARMCSPLPHTSLAIAQTWAHEAWVMQPIAAHPVGSTCTIAQSCYGQTDKQIKPFIRTQLSIIELSEAEELPVILGMLCISWKIYHH